MPVYNGSKYIAKAIQSVLDQTHQNFELIIVDDGSTDETVSIVNSFIKSLKEKIHLICQSNGGVSVARNTALNLAQGEWVAFLDCDDVWKIDKLEKQLKIANANKSVGLIYSYADFVDEELESVINYSRINYNYRGSSLIELFCKDFLITSSVMIRRQVIQGIGHFNSLLRVGEDYEFFLRVLAVTEIDLVEEPLFQRRILPTSLSRLSFVDDWLTDLKTLHNTLARHPELIELYSDRIFSRLGELYFSLGYQCLEEGYNRLALKQLITGLNYERSWRFYKNIFLCLMPFLLRDKFRKLTKRLARRLKI